jgi:hypothetical protein
MIDGSSPLPAPTTTDNASAMIDGSSPLPDAVPDKQLKQIKRKQLQDKQMQFATSCTKDDIEFNIAKNAIISIKGAQFSSWTCDMMKKFLRKNSVSVGKGDGGKQKLHELMVQFYIGTRIRDRLADGGRSKKKAKSSKPEAVSTEGTYYRVINSFLHPDVKAFYLMTGASFDRAALDAKSGHRDKWAKIFELYADKDNDSVSHLNVKQNRDFFTYASIPNDIAKTYDDLTLEDFIATVEFINFHYKTAKQNNEKSGEHGDFSDYVGGKVWLVFYNAKLEELGDSALDNMVCPRLDDSVYLTPAKLMLTNKHQDKVEGDTKGGRGSKKVALSEQALSSAVKESAVRAKRERIRHMMTRVYELRQRMDEIKKDPTLDHTDKKTTRKFVKKQLKLAEMEYNELKEDLNWDSAVSDSSDSSSDDSSE